MFNEGLTADYVVEKMVLLVPMGRGDGYNNMDVPVSKGTNVNLMVTRCQPTDSVPRVPRLSVSLC